MTHPPPDPEGRRQQDARTMRATVLLRDDLYDVHFEGCKVPWKAGFDLLPDLLAELERMGVGEVTIGPAALAHHAARWRELSRPSLVDQEDLRIIARAALDDFRRKREP